MRVGLRLYRRVLLVCAVAIVSVALVLAFGVIRPVKAEAYRGATPEQAVLAFWVNIGFNLLSASALFVIALPSRRLSWISRFVVVIVGLMVMFLGIALADAGTAYQSHGPAMRIASILLLCCAAADFLAGIAVTAAAILLPKEPR